MTSLKVGLIPGETAKVFLSKMQYYYYDNKVNIHEKVKE